MFFYSKTLLISIVLLFGLSGCVSFDVNKSPASSLTNGFVAKKDYSLSYDKMWDVIKNVLDNERVPIANTDKAEGRITTEYVKGQQSMSIGLLGAWGHTLQHKYSISLEKNSSSVHVNIIATVEVQEATQGGGWRPLGSPEKAKALEDWLYEKIEKATSGLSDTNEQENNQSAASVPKKKTKSRKNKWIGNSTNPSEQ